MDTDASADDWDLVVVGASFAGAACALAAAQYGLRVCVLERKADPGARLHTTGIIVKEAIEQTWLGRAPAELLQRVEQVRLYAPNLRSVLLAAPGYYFMTTDTPNLLRWLSAELQANGVQLRLQQSFTHARRDGTGWQVEGAGRTRYLIGADGAASRVAQRTGLGRVRDNLYGVEQEFAGAHLPASASRRATSAGRRRIQPGYRSAWPCATMPPRHGNQTWPVFCGMCARWWGFRRRRSPPPRVPDWCRAGCPMARSPRRA